MPFSSAVSQIVILSKGSVIPLSWTIGHELRGIVQQCRDSMLSLRAVDVDDLDSGAGVIDIESLVGTTIERNHNSS